MVLRINTIKDLIDQYLKDSSTAMGADWDSISSKTFTTSSSATDNLELAPDPCLKMEAQATVARFWHVSQPGHSKVKLFGIKSSSLLRSPVIKGEKVGVQVV